MWRGRGICVAALLAKRPPAAAGRSMINGGQRFHLSCRRHGSHYAALGHLAAPLIYLIQMLKIIKQDFSIYLWKVYIGNFIHPEY